jgi:hypothetical protein
LGSSQEQSQPLWQRFQIVLNDGMMPNPDLAAWTRTDRLIKAWITATISEEALGTVVGLTTSLDVWKALSNAYSQDSQAREFELLLKVTREEEGHGSFN